MPTEMEQWRDIAVDHSVTGTATMNKMELVRSICVAQGLESDTAEDLEFIELIRWWAWHN